MADDVIFDTHAHLIADDYTAYPASPLRGTTHVTQMTYSATAEWLIDQMDANGVGKACIVQRGHVYGYDNSYIIDSGKKYPDRFVPVVILDAQDPETPAKYRDMALNHGVRGLRLAQTHFEFFDTAWMNSPEAMECWRTAADLGTPVAIIFFRRHLSWALPALKFIAEYLPSLPIIVDHIGTPHTLSNPEKARYDAAGLDSSMPPPPDFGIAETIAMFEKLPNVSFKFTEINMERLADQRAEPSRFIRRLADAFGADRLMWGSDLGQSEWPYADKAQLARQAAAELNADERRAFLYGTADRLYAR
ncbi:amidohydrolase [Sphingobium phenoxybenzoativorans]|uniref:Amidohydrolase n=1 Tax=Sphingobium phenoxybenzoativorans TaxID=1592790 RepID=A0A975K8Z5_9SPHN|nr:amidohydrolase family protein [Sphingobium phenoxybenzoativorans]QUT06965.1 amidohydrolase [Sphingobium phenoxybenzoativorans]